MISHSSSPAQASPSPVNSWLRTSFRFRQTFSSSPIQTPPNYTSLPTSLDPSSSSSVFNSQTLALALIFGIFASYVFHHLKKKNLSIPPLPPGPKPLPILGNLLDIPVERDYETYTQWKDVYGDVIYLSALGNDIIILNSVRAAYDLLDKRSLIYSDRPYIPMIQEDSLMGFNWTLIFMNYSPAWRRHRRLFAKYIPNSASASSRHAFRSRELSSAHNLLRLFLQSSTPSGQISDPYSYRTHMRSVFANVLVGVAYGFDVLSGDDPHVDLCERSVQLVNYGISPGSYLVNLFPILKHIPAWMPFNYAKAHGKLVRQTHAELKDYPMAKLHAQLAAGTAMPSFATNALMDKAEALAKSQATDTNFEKEAHSGMSPIEENDISEDDIKHIAASMYGAGFDTTFAPLLFTMLNLLLNPSIQRKAHAELDSVLGYPDSSTFRLPTWEDRPNLPYVNAILQESLRWIPPTPGGLPHALSRSFYPSNLPDTKISSESSPTKEYDTYRNWRIPRGSTIIPNVYCMLHDPEVYHDPYTFKPDRFLRQEYVDEQGNLHVLREPEPHPSDHGVFGFGRRACPGQYLADSILWIELVNLLACFEVVPALDEKGQPIDVSWAKSPVPTFVLHPPAFPCLFKPRSDIVVRKIKETDPEL